MKRTCAIAAIMIFSTTLWASNGADESNKRARPDPSIPTLVQYWVKGDGQENLQINVGPLMAAQPIAQQRILEMLLDSSNYGALAALSKTCKYMHSLTIAQLSDQELTAANKQRRALNLATIADSRLPALTLIEKIKGLSGNTEEFDTHHLAVFKTLSPHVLRKILAGRWFKDCLNKNGVWRTSAYYYHNFAQYAWAQQLSLERHHLTVLPPSFYTLSTIKWVGLASNHLMSLSPAISKLTALQELYLSKNLLPALPSEIGALTTLRVLAISGNYLREVPQSLAQLTLLTRLYLGGNRLESLPNLSPLKGLITLHLSNNRLKSVPYPHGWENSHN